jgi:hypothetical protein
MERTSEDILFEREGAAADEACVLRASRSGARAQRKLGAAAAREARGGGAEPSRAPARSHAHLAHGAANTLAARVEGRTAHPASPPPQHPLSPSMLPPISICLLIVVTLHTAYLIAQDPLPPPNSSAPSSQVKGLYYDRRLDSMANNINAPSAAEGGFRSQLNGGRFTSLCSRSSLTPHRRLQMGTGPHRRQCGRTGGTGQLAQRRRQQLVGLRAAAERSAHQRGGGIHLAFSLGTVSAPRSHFASLGCADAKRPRRLLGFLACLAGSATCFLLAFLYLINPITFVTRPDKFPLAFSLGSVLFMIG